VYFLLCFDTLIPTASQKIFVILDEHL